MLEAKLAIAVAESAFFFCVCARWTVGGRLFFVFFQTSRDFFRRPMVRDTAHCDQRPFGGHCYDAEDLDCDLWPFSGHWYDTEDLELPSIIPPNSLRLSQVAILSEAPEMWQCVRLDAGGDQEPEITDNDNTEVHRHDYGKDHDEGADAQDANAKSFKRRQRSQRTTEEESRLFKNGWSRIPVESKRTRTFFVYIGPDGQRLTTLKSALRAIRVCRKA